MNNTTIGNTCSRFSSGDTIRAGEINASDKFPVFGGNGLRGYSNKSNFVGECAIIGRQGALCGNVKYFEGEAFMTEHAIVAVANEDNVSGYLALVFELMNLGRYQGQSAQPGLSVNTLLNVKLSVHDKSEQSKIFSFINTINKKVDNNNKINIELESMAMTLYDYWFMQFEFPNEEGKSYKSFGGKMVWCDELNKEIPEGWEARQIGDILITADKSKIQVNGAKEKGEFPFFTSGESILAYHKYFVDGFNVFLNTGGNPDIKAYKGKCAYSTDTWCISAKQYSYILYHYLLKLMPQFEQLFFAGSGLKHLQKDALKSKYILLPDNIVLEAFNESCSSIWGRITNCSIQNLELSSLRDFLLPLLMNSQVTFK